MLFKNLGVSFAPKCMVMRPSILYTRFTPDHTCTWQPHVCEQLRSFSCCRNSSQTRVRFWRYVRIGSILLHFFCNSKRKKTHTICERLFKPCTMDIIKKRKEETWKYLFIIPHSTLSYKCYVSWYFRLRSSRDVVLTKKGVGTHTPKTAILKQLKSF